MLHSIASNFQLECMRFDLDRFENILLIVTSQMVFFLRAPLTHKDESLNQPIAQIVNDNLYDIGLFVAD